MLTTIYYFVQVILCSGFMMGYYWLVLRDKKFHQYNRFYLLFTAAVSWIIPLIKIQWEPHPTSKLPVYELFYMVAENNSRIESNLHRNWFQWNWQSMLTGVYVIVSIVLCIILIIGMIRIARILRKHPINTIDNFFLIITNVQGTPFSFFKYIFWNEQIDLQSESGKQILQHEITHVQQKHSIDKLFVQLALVAGWFNPFFWLIKGELSMIHEYIADKKSVEHGDTASLAAMLLTAAYPRHPFLLSNPFFFSPIKRRIAMLTNQTKPKYSYLRRLIILPVMAIVLVLFAFRSKESRVKQPISLQGLIENVYNELKPASSNSKSATDFRLMPLKKKYMVVLHPGHGGADPGAKAPDGTKESELVLKYAQLIKTLNNNDHIEFILSRTDDKYMHVVEVTDFINNQNPDLAISIHANTSLSSLKDMNGSGVYFSKTGISFNESYALANNIATNLKDATFNFNGIKTRNDGVYILKNTKCPIVETEIGYLSNISDLKKLKDPTYQKALASAILQGVQDYLYRKENTFSTIKDTTILNGDSVKNGTIIIKSEQPKVVQGYKTEEKSTSGEKSSLHSFDSPNLNQSNDLSKAMYLIDGLIVDSTSFKMISPNDIYNINILSPKQGEELFGEQGSNGVIDIKTKLYIQIKGFPSGVTTIKKGFDMSETMKEFYTRNPDIKNVYWSHSPLTIHIYLNNGSAESYDLTNADSKALAEKRYGILPPIPPPPPPGPVSKPETVVKGYKLLEKPASFPGGKAAWLKYLERNLNVDLPVKKGGPPGTYTVIVQFMISAEGVLSNIKALNNPGYETAAEAVRVIAKGPKWEPALQNGKKVASIVKQSITFVISED